MPAAAERLRPTQGPARASPPVDAPLRPIGGRDVGSPRPGVVSRAAPRPRRQRLAQLEAEIEASRSILAALPDPLFLIDRQRRIRRLNPAAVSRFRAAEIGHDLAVAIRNAAFLDAVDEVLAGGDARQIEVEIEVAGQQHELVARVEPVLSRQAAALVALTDMTSIRKAERLRSDFVANASHELRTPLAIVMGVAETLEGPAADDAEARRRFLPIIRHQAARMAGLVDDLLSLSRIEHSEPVRPGMWVDLPAIVREAASTLELKTGATSDRIRIEATAPLPSVPGDAGELVRVFQNLIDNALKYGSDTLPVEIAIGPSSGLRGGIAVAVRNQGEAIACEHIPRLTERFYRADTLRSRAVGGSGLGLAIVKHSLVRHRGMLEIDSTPERGTTFTVHLPGTASASAM